MGRRTLSPGKGAAEGSTLQKDKIIEAMALEMSEGNWHPFRTVRAYAAEYGCSVSNMERYAAEATRLLRLSWGQDAAKVAVIERIAQIGRLALEREEDALDAQGQIHSLRKPDHRTALASAKHLADMLGLSGANSEVVVRYQQMSDSDLWREAQRFAAQLTGQIQNGSFETTSEEVPQSTGATEAGGDSEDETAALHRLDADDARRGR